MRPRAFASVLLGLLVYGPAAREKGSVVPEYTKQELEIGKKEVCWRPGVWFMDLDANGARDLVLIQDSERGIDFYLQSPEGRFVPQPVRSVNLVGRGWYVFDIVETEGGDAWLYGLAADGVYREKWHGQEASEKLLSATTFLGDFEPEEVGRLRLALNRGGDRPDLVVIAARSVDLYSWNSPNGYRLAGSIPFDERGIHIDLSYGQSLARLSWQWLQLNGDSHIDFVRHEYRTGDNYRLGRPSGFSAASPIRFATHQYHAGKHWATTCYQDLNGDGMADGFRFRATLGLVSAKTTVDVFLSSGGDPIFPPEPDHTFTVQGFIRDISDVDGDGRKEFVCLRTEFPPPSLDSAARVLLSRGMTTELRILNLDGKLPPYGRKPLQLNEPRNWWQTGSVGFADVDRDGSKEVFALGDPSVQVYRLTERGPKEVGRFSIEDAAAFELEDLNGDGWPEFYRQTQKGKYLVLYWSNIAEKDAGSGG